MALYTSSLISTDFLNVTPMRDAVQLRSTAAEKGLMVLLFLALYMSWTMRRKTNRYRSVMLSVMTKTRGTASARRPAKMSPHRCVSVNSTAYETDAATRDTN